MSSALPEPVPSAPSLRFEPGPDGSLVLRVAGRLDVHSAGLAWRSAMARVDRTAPRRLVVDASGLDYCDGAGLGVLVGLREHQERGGREFELVGLRDDLSHLLRLYEPGPPAPRPPRTSFFVRVGQG